MKSPLQLKIARDTIVSQVAAFLYATKQVPESLEIYDIKFISNDKELVLIEVYLKEDEVDVIYFHDT